MHYLGALLGQYIDFCKERLRPLPEWLRATIWLIPGIVVPLLFWPFGVLLTVVLIVPIMFANYNLSQEEK